MEKRNQTQIIKRKDSTATKQLGFRCVRRTCNETRVERNRQLSMDLSESFSGLF